jgi:hypothetical protein
MPLGGVIASAPGAASSASGSMDVFARGTDGALWTRRQIGSTWTNWTTLGGVIK